MRGLPPLFRTLVEDSFFTVKIVVAASVMGARFAVASGLLGVALASLTVCAAVLPEDEV